jgi:pseudouridine-5'-phosphate glycosidase
MPYPQNVETARAVEQIILENHAVPATIAILNGKVHIGEHQPGTMNAIP